MVGLMQNPIIIKYQTDSAAEGLCSIAQRTAFQLTSKDEERYEFNSEMTSKRKQLLASDEEMEYRI